MFSLSRLDGSAANGGVAMITSGTDIISRMPKKALDILRAQASKYGVRPSEITNSTCRDSMVTRARREVCRDLRRRGWSLTRIGRVVGLNHTSVLKHTRDIPFAHPKPPSKEAKPWEPDYSGEWAI